MTSILQRFRALFPKDHATECYQWKADTEGLNFFLSPDNAEKIKHNQAELWLSNQHVLLSMLAEQGQAEIIPHGFIVPTLIAVSLDATSKEALELPPTWLGHIKADFKGQTFKSSFAINLKLETEPTRYTSIYQTIGPILQLEGQSYLQTPAQALLFSALAAHQRSARNEADNLRLVMAIQAAQATGINMTLPVFDKMDLFAPNKVTLTVETDQEGNLLLTPNLGQKATPAQMQQALEQLRRKDTNIIRVGDEILLLDEKRLTAVHEILRNRKVPKDKIKDFYQTPSAFIDASLIELDVGFSARVQGATYFKHAYFGETEASGADWFGSASEIKPPSVLPISQLIQHIKDEEDLRQFQQQWEDAKQIHAQVLAFKHQHFDISNPEAVEQALVEIQRALEPGELPWPDPTQEETFPPEEDTPDDSDDSHSEGSDTSETGTIITGGDSSGNGSIVVKPEDNDGTLGFDVSEYITAVSYPIDQLDWSDYLRQPYPHQTAGIAWIVGLALKGLQENKPQWGGLLADDMGLGKTYMALAAIEQLFRIRALRNDQRKPSLIVAPLSVLQNWKDEVAATFRTSPFTDIIILQSDADMKSFRVGGKETKQDFSSVETEQNLPEAGDLAKIRYSLKVGSDYNLDNRLDTPGRLIITTYQTLRDYQFSLCKIPWSMVIFDEAQNIKNPNAMQTRAAKGLNTEFCLLATGTPVENSLADFWCLMDTAVPGLLGSYQDFRQTYITPILQAAKAREKVDMDEVRFTIGKQLRQATGAFMLRRIKENEIEGLPQKTIHVGLQPEPRSEDTRWQFEPKLEAVMQGFQQDSYEAIIEAHHQRDTNEALATLHRLRDVSLHPYLLDKGKLTVSQNASQKDLRTLIKQSSKLQSLLPVLDAIRQKQEKCIIFCINKQLQQFLSLALGNLYRLGSLPIINGDTKTVDSRNAEKTRKGMISAFEAKTGFNLIIMSPIAAGVGLTVVGANHAIHLERHWNPAKEAQASDRIYRIGQSKDVHIYVPILHHPTSISFDVNLHQLLSKKILLKDAVVTTEQVVPEMPDITINQHKRITANDLHQLSWQHFEACCAELFLQKLQATDCWLTNPGQDKGADIALLSKDGISLIQCKHTKNKNSNYDGYKAIQEVFAAKPIYASLLKKEVHHLFFVTNAKKISSEAQRVAKDSGVTVCTYHDLANMLETYTIKLSDVYQRLSKPRLKNS